MQDDNLVTAPWTPATEVRLPEDHSLLPSEFPAWCYTWIGRGPQKGRWRINPVAKKAYLLSLAERDTRVRPATPRTNREDEPVPWGLVFGIALAVLFGPGLVVAAALALIGLDPYLAVGAGTLMVALTFGKLMDIFQG